MFSRHVEVSHGFHEQASICKMQAEGNFIHAHFLLCGSVSLCLLYEFQGFHVFLTNSQEVKV